MVMLFRGETMDRARRTCVCVCCWFALSSLAALAAEPAAPAGESADLAARLGDRDLTVQQAALDRVRELVAEPPEVSPRGQVKYAVKVDTAWLKSLMKVRRYDDAASLALQGMLREPSNMAGVTAFAKYRTQALTAAGKHEEALAAAKGYYNVCTLKNSAGAIDLVAQCLQSAHSDDAAIARRFKVQQIELATTQPTTTLPANVDANVLRSIKVDATPFLQAVDTFKLGDFNSLSAQGNLLLLADRPAEAKKCFEQSLQIATGDVQLAKAIEGVARAIRAETGAIGPANAYVIAQRGE